MTFRMLSEIGKSDLFPKEFLKQEDFAVLLLKNHLEETFMTLEEIILHSEHEIEFEGRLRRFYLFQYRFSKRSENWLAGVSGPFPLDSKEMLLPDTKAKTEYAPLESISAKEHILNSFSELPTD